ncbi:hypothetical protein H5410_021020 [Solanum commersonii]|uniref:Uncharacterized protein n=1 Tax=Solanum commersonii TaxID=4109 RepID=A0A9J5Z9S4_SOLCO|nr:hypothetical protein H5410_021020 [Solanum commersonii]
MAEVQNLLLERRKFIKVRLDSFETRRDLSNNSASSSSCEGESNNTDFLKIINFADLNYIQEGLIPSSFLKGEINSIELDSVIQNPKLQDKIAILQNQFSIEIYGDHPNTFWNRKKHVLIEANSSSSTSGTSGIDMNHPMYKEFMDFMKSKKESDNNLQTYSTILMDDENIEIFDLNDKRQVILLLENGDLRWKNEP